MVHTHHHAHADQHVMRQLMDLKTYRLTRAEPVATLLVKVTELLERVMTISTAASMGMPEATEAKNTETRAEMTMVMIVKKPEGRIISTTDKAGVLIDQIGMMTDMIGRMTDMIGTMTDMTTDVAASMVTDMKDMSGARAGATRSMKAAEVAAEMKDNIASCCFALEAQITELRKCTMHVVSAFVCVLLP